MSIKLVKQQNRTGDESLAAQGFGRISEEPARAFNPAAELEPACEFFQHNGFAVLAACLDDAEVEHLNSFYDRTQIDRPDAWGLSGARETYHESQGLIFSQPLLDYPELDPYTRHPASFPVVEALLGGAGSARFSEFNFREAPANAGIGAMNFHHDRVLPDRLTRAPYMPCDWLCAIHYLTDVIPGIPAFCVVPRSNRFETLAETHAVLGDEYVELPIYGAAGTCVLYDTALFHTRLDGDGEQPRRTWHQYYARGGWCSTGNGPVRPPSPVLTSWNLFPERLALHPDPAVRLFFSHWNTAQGEWAASDFDPEVRGNMPRGHH